MEASLSRLNTSREFLTYFKAGKDAARQGGKALGHPKLRHAIEIDPHHDPVWLWLA